MTETIGRRDLVAEARRIATEAHAGQVDKIGDPYIGHPERVAEHIASVGAHDAEAIAVAWLHDVVEDTDVTLDALRSAGFDEYVVAAVDAVTRRRGESAAEYYGRVSANSLARLVKLADVMDNTDAERMSRLDPETRKRLARKYEWALRAIGRRDIADALARREACHPASECPGGAG
jgi:(p)ppGpp synthase/HD superfamily hydrolase